ncbi:MAG TPA: MoxR family ATPase [Planctomycetota bacterium]|nr:MoxR family ATPase [Planctomycetota bacterium]
MTNETDRKIDLLARNIETVFMGKPEAVRMTLVGLFAGGHILIEDVPGVGKTTLARALARSIDCSFRRIQFTPDLLPSDILGVSVYNSTSSEFVFKPGPIFANVVLADEINRTTPRTQSSLLEGMNDFQVTVDGHTWPLPQPFIVLATQNPYEYEGTYPLPESQLDRFFLKIRVGYPGEDDEKRLLGGQRTVDPLGGLKPVVSADDVLHVQERVRTIKVDASLVDYAMAIVQRTRSHDQLAVGVSPRGFLSLVRGAQALAVVSGRDYCLPDDVKALAVPITAHRVIPKRRHETSERCGEIIEEIVSFVEVPL